MSFIQKLKKRKSKTRSSRKSKIANNGGSVCTVQTSFNGDVCEGDRRNEQRHSMQSHQLDMGRADKQAGKGKDGADNDDPDPSGSESERTRLFESESMPDLARGKGLQMVEIHKQLISKSTPLVGARPLPYRQGGARDLTRFAPVLSKTLSETLDELQLPMEDSNHRGTDLLAALKSMHSLIIEEDKSGLQGGEDQAPSVPAAELVEDQVPTCLAMSRFLEKRHTVSFLDDPCIEGDDTPSTDGELVRDDDSIEFDGSGTVPVQRGSLQVYEEDELHEDDEPPDALAALCAEYVDAQQKEESINFVPGTETDFDNSILHLEDSPGDDVSVLTLDTHFRRMPLIFQKQQKRRLAVSKGARTSLGQQLSLASHQIQEPTAPFRLLKKAGVVDLLQHSSSPPRLLALRESVFRCTEAGDDGDAIDAVTKVLAADNGDNASVSLELALFCLTTLWVLAGKGNENKLKVMSDPTTFDGVLKAMQIHGDQSAEIQTTACGLLWSLSVTPHERKIVAKRRGCEAILNAMAAFPDDEALQTTALGALKVLSFDDVGRSMLRARGALSVVSGAMKKHAKNPMVQSEGCVALGNMAVNIGNKLVVPVSEREVDVIVQGISNHPDSLEVHEAACFTLVILASAAENVDLIHRNSMTREALELAFQKHSDDVGIYILHLMSRFRV